MRWLVLVGVLLWGAPLLAQDTYAVNPIIMHLCDGQWRERPCTAKVETAPPTLFVTYQGKVLKLCQFSWHPTARTRVKGKSPKDYQVEHQVIAYAAVDEDEECSGGYITVVDTAVGTISEDTHLGITTKK
jgi:hypothetical protein